MPVIIVEGADGAGKTTLCMKYLTIPDSLYVHFPIRDMKKDIISNCETPFNFTLCESLKGLTMLQIQDVILDNIELNSHEILRLHELGVTVILDRYVLSNLVYRLIHLNQEFIFDDKKAICSVMSVGRLVILTEDPEVLFSRISSRDSATDELDKINEEKRNIELANTIFDGFSKNYSTRSFI